MSTIDPDAIDTTQPPAVSPTTSGVRGVFAAVKAQFTAAKADVEALVARVLALESTGSVVGFAAGDQLSEERVLAGYCRTQEVAAVVAGGDYYDPAEHVIANLSRTLRCRVVLSSSDTGKIAHAQLYNLTDAALVQDFSTNHTTPTELTLDIVPGTTANFPDAKKLYEVHVYEDSGTGAESAILHKASLDVMHAE